MSLKHLLNDELEPDYSNNRYGNNDYADHRPISGWDEFGNTLDVIPSLSASWNDYTAGLLPSESEHFYMGQDDSLDALTFTQSHIQQWAADNESSETISSSPIPHLSTASEEEQICYGMIYRAPVRLRGDMRVLDAKLSSEHNSPVPGHYQMAISKSEEQFVVIFADGTALGDANAQLERALAGIAERNYSVDLEVFAPIQPIRQTIGRASKAKEAIVRVHVNIYGRRSSIQGLGKELARHKIYLQRPDYIKPGFLYDNPHVLKLPGFQLAVHEEAVELKEEQTPEGEMQKTEAFNKTISTIYSSLTRGQTLEGLEGDDRLKTRLLAHQKQALDFMMQREAGPIQERYRLWQPSEQEGVFCYRHSITNGTSTLEHKETGGGILADEMGMGKTLSILALTLRTLIASHDWVSGHNTGAEASYEQRKRRYSRATLIVASSDLMINEWFAEIARHFEERISNELSTIKYHGMNRETDIDKLCDADIVITTYHTLHSDTSKDNRILHDIEWYRLVLDEAHIIRRQSTVLYKAVAELRARSRWCLTGTPIQNRLEDIGSLFAFIRIIPFNSLSTFRKHIAIPFEEGGKRRQMAIDRFTRLLDSLCLRRTKDVLELPEPHAIVHDIELSAEERTQYEQTKKMMLRAAKNQVGGLDQKTTLGLFQVQLQLRILCNHGTWQQPFSWNRRKIDLLDAKEAEEASLGRDGEVTCSVCKQTMPLLGAGAFFRRFTENCRHVLCTECLEEADPGALEKESIDCPLCFQSLKQLSRHHAHEDDHYFQPRGRSSKMEALMRDVQKDVNRSKSIIFSCWTHTLDLIEKYLKNASINFARIDGECPTTKRQQILENFTKNTHLKVLIMTTGTGAVGLNLATANRVFLIEPQWNPSVENQAIARALRLGQEQQVQVHRYVVRHTVEQNMRSLQDRKLEMAGMAWE